MRRRSATTLSPTVIGLIAAVTLAAAAVLAATIGGAVDLAREEPLALLGFALLAAGLHAFSVEVYGSGRIGAGAVGILAALFALGSGPAIAIAAAAPLLPFLLRRPPFHRTFFDMGQLVLSTLAAALVFRSIHHGDEAAAFAAAVLAGLAFIVVNNGLLCVVMALAERTTVRRIWEDRFRWARYHYLTFGPLGYASARGYDAIGLSALLAFSLPPGLLLLAFRQYVERTTRALAEVKQANDALEQAVAELAESRDDLRSLYEFASGLAARATDQRELVAFGERALAELTNTRVRLSVAPIAAGAPLYKGGERVGTISFGPDEPTDERWLRVRDTILAQLVTALESAALVDHVQTTHLATIAALSRSIEAKDGSTGKHVERVSALSVALARRLGFDGEELSAIEVGGLLHDIGKIGVPETVLNKKGPLSAAERRAIEQHPLTSEYILRDIPLHPIVLGIARSSHERFDGKGYPDARWGTDIPLPARIVLVADAYDALTRDRPYRTAVSPEVALEEIRRNAGSQFCPAVVAALEAVYREEPAAVGLASDVRVA